MMDWKGFDQAHGRDEGFNKPRAVELCRFCGQPMKPKGIKKLPNEYDHARGCPYDRKRGA